jgi:hypothetical protein
MGPVTKSKPVRHPNGYNIYLQWEQACLGTQGLCGLENKALMIRLRPIEEHSGTTIVLSNEQRRCSSPCVSAAAMLAAANFAIILSLLDNIRLHT